MSLVPLSPDDQTERLDRGAQPVRAPTRPEPRRRVSARYTRGPTLGRGGMGEVFTATDGHLLRDVAMKQAHPGSDDETRARFIAEARIGGQLDHPGVLPVYDFGEDDAGQTYFAMKLVAAHRTLGDIITALQAGDAETEREFSFQRRVGLMQQVCRTLRYAHERGVVHRDLKPANIVVGSYGEVYVVDWGIARVDDAPGASDSTGGDKVNVSPEVRALLARFDAEAIMGTPGYMAPAYLVDMVSVPQNDVWSLCVVLYELLTLQHPFGNDHAVAKMRRAFDRLPPKAAEAHRDVTYGRVPRALSQLLQRGLGPDEDARWASAGELEHALQQWLEGASPIVCPGTLIQRVLARAIYLIDQRPVLVPMLVLVAFCVTLSLFVSWLLSVALD